LRDGLRIALDGPLLRLLALEAHGLQNAPDMDVAVLDAEVFLDEQAYSLDRPQIGAVSGGHRPGQQGFAQRFDLFSRHEARASALAHLAQAVDAFLLRWICMALLLVHRSAKGFCAYAGLV
jgi:hypothetical protein